MSQPVAVVIVSYNSAAILKDALDGLSRQVFRNFSTVVVDNGSRDDPVGKTAPDVAVLRLPENVGFARANNRGAELSGESRWIALLNPDAVPAADWLEKLLAAAEQEPEVACFASRTIQARQPGVLDGAGDAYHVSGRVWRRGYDAPLEGAYDRKEEVFSACGAAALYRRDALAAAGGFDDDFFCYLEDVDLGFRLRLAGYRCVYVPEAIVYHVGSAITGKGSDFAVYHGQRNLVWTYVKNMPGLLFWLYLPQHVALNILAIIRYALKGRWRVILRAKRDAIRGLPAMWKKRGEIQARRTVGAWELRRMMARGLPRKPP